MVKQYIKRLKKMSPDFQARFIQVIEDIENDNLNHLDITQLTWKKWYFRCRVWKFRIIFYKDDSWDYVIEQIWSRWDIYK